MVRVAGDRARGAQHTAELAGQYLAQGRRPCVMSAAILAMGAGRFQALQLVLRTVNDRHRVNRRDPPQQFRDHGSYFAPPGPTINECLSWSPPGIGCSFLNGKPCEW